MIRKSSLTKEQALQKARHYCAYQERCHSEVKEKLYSFGLWKKDVEEAISLLIEENYLNEERFALQFAGGRFRMKHWGRIRIRYELKQRQVSEYCIKKALAAIDEEDYLLALEKLAAAKWESLGAEKPETAETAGTARTTGTNSFIRRGKLQEYLIRKGYESGLISQTLKAIGEKS